MGGDALIVMTQDAIPATAETFANLISELQLEPLNGVAYGRQLPHPGAGVLGAQSRHFNYPAASRTKRLDDAAQLGIKTCFSSDSFSVYRRSALSAVGGFPQDVIGSEDAYVAARMLLAGYQVRYAASAQVYHSHDYRLLEEFRASQAGYAAKVAPWNDLSRGAPLWIDGPDENAKKMGMNPLLSGERSEDEGLFVCQHNYWAQVMRKGLQQEREGEQA